MAKKQKKNNNAVTAITTELVEKCQITCKPSYTPSGKTKLDDQINPEILAKWPKLKLKIPPIFLHRPVDFAHHVRKVLHLGIKFYQPNLTKAYTRIICETSNDYKNLVQYFTKKELPYHTFGNPSKRKMKVVIRGLPADTDLNVIKEELKSFSIPVIRVHKMVTKAEMKDKTMLVLIVVPYDDDGKAVLKVTELLGHKVTLEPPKQKLRQCYRCQKWGHSQRFCYGAIKCVKCAGDHLTKKCDKTPDVEPKCANCGKAHTASFKNCVSAQITDNKNKKVPKHFFYKTRQIVTMDNYHTLYKNIPNKTSK